MLLRDSVERRETPERIVTPVKASLLLNDSTVTEVSSADIAGIKHSMLDIGQSVFVYQRQM